MTAPAASAAAIPTPRLFAQLAPRAPQKAPVSICPSMAMLMTPVRSHMTPASAPRISGTARVSDCSSRLTMSIGDPIEPVPAQQKKATTKSTATAVVTHGSRFFGKPRATW